jgi:hypothetical protein
LRAGQLDELRRLIRAAPPLEERERGQERGVESAGQIALDPQGHGIAGGGGHEVGRQMEAEHANGGEYPVAPADRNQTD